ncbi:MAG TPA: DUF1295 domain-containing protein [Gammaproteobacteria bacterium]|nr:DUF1295 domain-containing protein [Gammaproteobacteria bacterium]
MSAWELLGLVLAVDAVLMFLLWLAHLPLRNAGIVDIGWVYAVALSALIFTLLGPGDPGRSLAAACMAGVWGLRLGTYLLFRVFTHPEDARYAALRSEWGGNVALRFLGFFELQALLAVVFALPAFFAAMNPSPELGWPEYLGLALWVAGVAGEALADKQLKDFKANPANRGRICQAGLWNYSRHPNYFFEFLVWLGFAVFALGSPHGYIAFVCPALMLFFLFKVTGIPATEAQALRSKGEAYREYQRTTSAFVPWFPRKG